MRISDWSSDVCSSDLRERLHLEFHRVTLRSPVASRRFTLRRWRSNPVAWPTRDIGSQTGKSSATSRRNMLNIAWPAVLVLPALPDAAAKVLQVDRSEEHTSELQSLMRNSYAVFCLKKKKTTK